MAPQLTSALEGDEWSASRSDRFTLGGNRPLAPAGLASQAVWKLWSVEKSLIRAKNRTLAVQPVYRTILQSVG
jgi:hypothetical protein